MSGLSNSAQAILMLLAFILPVWIAWTANGSPMDRTSISLVFSGSLGGILAFIKEVLGGKAPDTQPSGTPATVTRMTKLRSFLTSFMFNKSAIFGHSGYRGQYDPDPGRRRHKRRRAYDPGRKRGHRKGVEPAGLKRWRLAHRRTHDPRPRRHFRRRVSYDAPRRRFSRARSYASRAGRGIEGKLNKWGTILGAFIGLGAGLYQGLDAYGKAYGPSATNNYLASIIGGNMTGLDGKTSLGNNNPEISHLIGMNDPWWSAPRGPLDYLRYKLLGQDYGGAYVGSAWVIPFWVSFAAWIGSTIGLKIGRLGKAHRFLRPINKLAKGSTIATFIAALALPGCEKTPQTLPPPPTANNVITMQENPQVPKQFTYTG